MRYRRALLVAEPGDELASAAGVLRRFAPELEHLVVLAAGGEDRAPLAALRRATTGTARRVSFRLSAEVDAEELEGLLTAEDVELLVFPTRSLRSVSLVSIHRPRVAVLWASGGVTSAPLRKIGGVLVDDRSAASIAAFLRDHTDPSIRVALLSPLTISAGLIDAAREVAGVRAEVSASSLIEAESIGGWMRAFTDEGELDLLVFARLDAALLFGALSAVPVLLLPARASGALASRTIDVPDVLDTGRARWMRVDQSAPLGDLDVVDDQDFTLVCAGEAVCTVRTEAGLAELPGDLEATSYGVARVGGGAQADAVAAIEASMSVVRPSGRPLVLFDAELGDEQLGALAALAGAAELLAVRLRPSQACRALRERLRVAGLAPLVVDARAVLDEGPAFDVSELLDPLRLARVARRLRAEGLEVLAIVHRGPGDPATDGFVAIDTAALESARRGGELPLGPATRPRATARGGGFVGGHRVALEIDNRTAKRWLLEAIAASRSSLHVQTYLATDDDVGAELESALVDAAGRGVRVRFLIDSLHGFHGSFGVRNALLERLERHAGIEVRSVRPITELPSVIDLKLRDHRKLVVADDRVALVGGRNLAHEYYASPDELSISPRSAWRELPWLDAGARIEGPEVATIASSFLDAWLEAGGEPFEIQTPGPVGSTPARVVMHRGLRDTHTLETYRELIDAARARLLLVTGYPLLLELQHALRRALRRGVQLGVLVGYAVPTHGGRPFPGAFVGPRMFATELVHSRLDPLVEAGAEVHLYTLRDVRGWSPELGPVQAHVHAKLLTVDGLRCMVGSANPDITASYWESELSVVVEDAEVVAPLDAQIQALLARSPRVQRDDPAWQALARRRSWMSHWPGLLSA